MWTIDRRASRSASRPRRIRGPGGRGLQREQLPSIPRIVGAPIGNQGGGSAGRHRGAVRGRGAARPRRRRRPARHRRRPEPAVGARDDLKIVYTGSLQLVVGRPRGALAKAKAAVLATGGYIGASQESNDGDRSVATITYRIPAARWDDAIGGLRGLASQVVAEQTQATEVGGQIVDLEARLRNLRASETSLQAIAQGTGKVTDLLEVEAQLTDVRGQIEELDGQRAQLEDQVALRDARDDVRARDRAGPGDRPGLGSGRPTSTARPRPSSGPARRSSAGRSGSASCGCR